MSGGLSFTALQYISDNLVGGKLRGGTAERNDADRRLVVALRSLVAYFEGIDNQWFTGDQKIHKRNLFTSTTAKHDLFQHLLQNYRFTDFFHVYGHLLPDFNILTRYFFLKERNISE